MENPIIQNFNGVVFEGLTAISALIGAIESGKNDRKIKKILFDKAKIKSKNRELSFLKAKSYSLGYDLSLVTADEIDSLANGNTHGGILALCTERNLPDLSPELINKDGIYYIFEGIEDPFNFGYAIRSVYLSGADGIIMSPRNWLSAASVVAKSSAGCSELIDMFISEPEDAVDTLKSLGFSVVSAGIRDSVSVYDADIKRPVLVIIGGEKRGISRKLLDKSDKIIRIDYGRDFKGSLPSVAATAIISFEIMKQTKMVKGDR